MARCIIEANLTTSNVSYPFRKGWLETPDWLTLQERVDLDDLSGEPACALIDAIDATRLVESHAVITDLALVSTHHGPIWLYSNRRPDEIDHAVVQLGEVSSVAEAVARSTIHHFYGIDVVDWNRSSQQADVTVVEGVEALREPEEGHLEDLVRAWFILTSLALPTHVFVAPIAVLQDDPGPIEQMISTLHEAVNIADERRREVRRNLSGDHDLDRDLLTDFLDDQKLRLTRSGRKGWLDLAQRVQRAMHLPDPINPVLHSLGKGDGE